MAGVSTKEIKNRIRSMESTKQITKAMEMVAASKLRRAQARAANARPYFEILQTVARDMAAAGKGFTSPYLQGRVPQRRLYVVIAGDRGLAGGYNSNILKLVQSQVDRENDVILPIGKKALDFFQSKQYTLLSDAYPLASEIGVGSCFSIAKQICAGYLSEAYDEVFLVYTQFVSVLSQVPGCVGVLPLNNLLKDSPSEHKLSCDTVYEGDSEEVFAAIVPEYLGGMLYGAMCESVASEQAARRSAMDSATQNADEMIADLSLKFNRARQAAITQEITEIVAGS